MKVILLQEVKGKGGEGDVVDVARGYAVNYLFPRKMAVQATSGNLKQLEQRMDNIRQREENRVQDAQGLAGALEGKVVTISAKVGEEGRLYGSVTSTMIEDAIAEQLDVDVERRKIDAHGHIKETGQHEVIVQVYRDIKAHVTVNVVAEGEPIQTMIAEEQLEEEPEEQPQLTAGEGEAALPEAETESPDEMLAEREAEAAEESPEA